MSQRIVFLVHGVGEHRPGWSTSVEQKIKQVAKGYAALADGVEMDAIKFVEIAYNDVFQKRVQDFGSSAGELEKFANSELGSGATKANLGKLFTWLQESDDGDVGGRAFFWTHAFDVIFYRFFELVETPVSVRVMRQFAEALTAAMAAEPGAIVDACVISHSLGTAVMSDALARLGTEPFGGSNAFMAGRGDVKFKHIFTLANVSRLLRNTIDPYASVLHPDSAVVNPASEAYCTRYTAFKHVLDPICWLHPFDPPATWGDGFRNVNDLKHLRAINVHGFEHYLDNPRVHIPIINGIFERPVIDSAARQRAIDDYPAIAGPCVDELRALADAIEALAQPTDIQEVVIRAMQVHAMAIAAQARCAALGGAVVHV